MTEVTSSIEAFEASEIAAQADVERIAQVLLDAGKPMLVQRYLTGEAHQNAHGGLELIQNLAIGLEARTRAIYGIRPPEVAGPPGDQF